LELADFNLGRERTSTWIMKNVGEFVEKNVPPEFRREVKRLKQRRHAEETVEGVRNRTRAKVAAQPERDVQKDFPGDSTKGRRGEIIEPRGETAAPSVSFT